LNWTTARKENSEEKNGNKVPLALPVEIHPFVVSPYSCCKKKMIKVFTK